MESASSPAARYARGDPEQDRGGHKAAGGFLDYAEEELHALRDQLQQIAESKRSLTHTALRYCMDQPAVGVTLAGASSVEQLRENAAASQAPPLTEESWQDPFGL